MPDDPSATVLVWIYPGVSAYEAVGALAAVRAAGRAAEMASAEALVHAREGARLVPARLGHDVLAGAAAVILPDGDARALLRDAALVRALRARRGQWLLASGDAVRVAHAADLVDGRRIARQTGAEALAGAEARPARLVADGRLLTSHGPDALVDLALHYVASVAGHEAATRACDALGREHRPYALGASTDG